MHHERKTENARKRGLTVLLAIALCLAAGCGQQTPEQAALPSETPAPTETPAPFEPCDALFLGDSVTAGNPFDEIFPELSIVDLGVNGATIQDLITYVPLVDAHHPAKIFVMAGGNNLETGNVDACAELFRNLLDELMRACPYAEIYVESMLPVDKAVAYSWNLSNRAIRTYNEKLAALAEEYGLTYIEIYPAYALRGGLNSEYSRDGVHLNDDAFGPWADILRPYLLP